MTKLQEIMDSTKLISSVDIKVWWWIITIETIKWLSPRKRHNIFISNILCDRSNTYFEKSLWVSDQVAEIIRNVDFRDVYIHILENWVVSELGELDSRGLAKGEYNFIYAKFK